MTKSYSDIDIKQVRVELGMTQEQFSEELGVSSRQVRNWEAGGRVKDIYKKYIKEILLG